MTRASFPCPRCGKPAEFVGEKRDKDGVTRRWRCVRCNTPFRTREGFAVEGRHWHRGPDGQWYDTAEA